MVAENTKILTAEQEAQLLAPIDEHVGAIQEKINALRLNGTDKVLDIQNSLENLKRDRIYTAEEKQKRAAELKKELEKAKEVEAKNKAEVSKLIAEAESYLKANYGAYYQAVVASCAEENVKAQENYKEAVEQLHKEHQETVSKLSDQQELKDEKYVHKNRLFDAKMNLLKEKQEMSMIFVTHDLGVISEMADRVMVMYGGRKCEQAFSEELFSKPLHPYTQGLIRSHPRPGEKRDRLEVIPGSVPALKDMPKGCPFHNRCPFAGSECKETFPEYEEAFPDHWVACHHWRKAVSHG